MFLTATVNYSVHFYYDYHISVLFCSVQFGVGRVVVVNCPAMVRTVLELARTFHQALEVVCGNIWILQIVRESFRRFGRKPF